MKVSVALAALLCAHVVLARERHVCSDNDLYIVPHEDCDKYYLCSAGAPYALNCPPGLLYNLDTQDCDWPQNVDCGDRNAPEDGGDGSGPVVTSEPEPVPTTTRAPETTVIVVETTTTAPSQNECPLDPYEEKLMPHPHCNKFYKCSYGKPVALDCQPGTLYNIEAERCDWPHQVDCGDRYIPEEDVNPTPTVAPTPTQPPTQVPTQVTEDDNDSNLFSKENDCPEDFTVEKIYAHENCHQFYQCSFGEPVALSCWHGLYFNVETMQCDWPHEVDCGDRIVAVTTHRKKLL